MGLPILDILDVVGKVVDRVIPDPAAKMQLQLELSKLADAESARASQEAIAQTEVNKVEAANRSVFVAGWRPFIGWVCGGSLAYNVIFAPMFHLQVADLGLLQTILMAMLGVGAMRSYDKAKGTANDVLPLLPVKKAVEAVTPLVPVEKKKVLGIKWPF